MKVLISAYACEPDKGSEPGVGWTWCIAAAKEHEVWVLTRSNNREAIEAELAHRPVPRLHFVYADLPKRWRAWKRGQRGVRLYYALWQVAALREARRLHGEIGFDVVHHLTFANLWLPALTCFVDAPFVLGPAGGGPRVPVRHYRELGVRGAAHEVAREIGRTINTLNPVIRASWRHASTILAQNEETRRSLPARHRGKTIVRLNACVPSSLATPPSRDRSGAGRRQALFAGRLLPWKGTSVAIRAIQKLTAWDLLIVGDGPDRRRLETLVERLGMTSRVTFVAWVPRNDLWQLMTKADALVLPSLREDAGLVVAEAQALGVPVVSFDQGGPRQFARYPNSTVEMASLDEDDIALALADALERTTGLRQIGDAKPYTIGTIAAFLGQTYFEASSRPLGRDSALTTGTADNGGAGHAADRSSAAREVPRVRGLFIDREQSG